jgi:phage terminase large subunit GpA-like protein
VAARSPRNLRRHTARILIVDEADAAETGAEGDPILLAEKRTLTFPNRKIIIGSTPIFADTSAVVRAYGQSDQRIYEVPCPECGGFTEIMWQHIVWPEDKPDEAAFQCPHCAVLIPERFKASMVGNGAWRITKPEVEGHAGFRLNSLVSLLANASWAKLAAEFLAAKSTPGQLQTFVNTVLGQGWSAPSMLSETALAARAEPIGLTAIPTEVLVLTAGADVQDDRVETSIVGWTRDNVALAPAHLVIWGSFQDQTTWQEVDELLRSRWRHPHGGDLKIDAACVDASDGDHYDAVLNFCVPKTSRRVFAIKGLYGARPGFAMAKGKRLENKLALIGVDTIKNIIFDRLQRSQGLRFSNTLEPVYYEQLASERRVLRYLRGQPVRRFERAGKTRNEALDCLVYAFAARQAIKTLSLERREAELRGTAAPPISIGTLLGRINDPKIDPKRQAQASEFRLPDRR